MTLVKSAAQHEGEIRSTVCYQDTGTMDSHIQRYICTLKKH